MLEERLVAAEALLSELCQTLNEALAWHWEPVGEEEQKSADAHTNSVRALQQRVEQLLSGPPAVSAQRKFKIVLNTSDLYRGKRYREDNVLTFEQIMTGVEFPDSFFERTDTLVVEDLETREYHKVTLDVTLVEVNLADECLTAYECTVCPERFVFPEDEVDENAMRDHLESHNPNAKNISDIWEFFKEVE